MWDTEPTFMKHEISPVIDTSSKVVVDGPALKFICEERVRPARATEVAIFGINHRKVRGEPAETVVVGVWIPFGGRNDRASARLSDSPKARFADVKAVSADQFERRVLVALDGVPCPLFRSARDSIEYQRTLDRSIGGWSYPLI